MLFLLCFTLYLRAIFQVQAPGGLYLEGRFNAGFFCGTSLGGLYLEGHIHGGAYFRNFTVCHTSGHNRANCNEVPRHDVNFCKLKEKHPELLGVESSKWRHSNHKCEITWWWLLEITGRDALLHKNTNEHTGSKFGETNSTCGAPHHVTNLRKAKTFLTDQYLKEIEANGDQQYFKVLPQV